MLKVYIAGKYSADNVGEVLQNIGKGRKIAADLFELGFSPFCPWHDTDFIILKPHVNVDVQKFRDYCLDWLKVSDILFVISGQETHTGVKEEIALAKSMNIPTYYNLNDLMFYKRYEHKMKWYDVKNSLPETNIPVLVSDGYGEFALVKLDDNKRWYLNNKDENILDAFHDEGVVSIEVNSDYIRFWTLIDSESCPLPDWKD